MPKAKTYDVAQFLDLLLEFFEDGRRWIRGTYEDWAGNRCLVGAISYVEDTYKISAFEARAALRQALPPAGVGLIGFNDSRKSFGEIRALILNARAMTLKTRERHAPADPAASQLRAWATAKVERMVKQYCAGKSAEADKAVERAKPSHAPADDAASELQAWARAKVAAMLEQYQAGSLAEAETAAPLREAGQEAKRFLFAEIGREHAARVATGDDRPTGIICPNAPTAPERLAA